MFTSQGQAKRFFVEKVIAQAATEGVPLSDAEKRMLSFSESDPEFVVSPEWWRNCGPKSQTTPTKLRSRA